MVSIPYRQAKNWTHQNTKRERRRVSIPYRQAKNHGPCRKPNTQKAVSIPYRQAKNNASVVAWGNVQIAFQFLIGRLKTQKSCLSFLFTKKFQFLIGRLKTQCYKLQRYHRLMFQFLIGRLKTLFLDPFPLLDGEFQFLIGRLKTKANSCYNLQILSVSIPYRQAKNAFSSAGYLGLSNRFNSLQVG